MFHISDSTNAVAIITPYYLVMGDLIVMSKRLLITSNSHTLSINVNNCRCDRATLSPASWSPQSIGWHIGASSWPVHPEYCWSIVIWMVNQQFFGWSKWNDDHTYWWTIPDRPSWQMQTRQGWELGYIFWPWNTNILVTVFEIEENQLSER